MQGKQGKAAFNTQFHSVVWDSVVTVVSSLGRSEETTDVNRGPVHITPTVKMLATVEPSLVP